MKENNEALESLERVCEGAYIDEIYTKENLEHDKGIIENELIELKAIKEANPSEALECLKEIGKTILFTDKETLKIKTVSEVYPNFYHTIKQALIKAQEQEKILNILKEKKIDLFDFIRDCIEGERTDYEWYETHYRKYSLEKLTQDEYNLLREVFVYGN